MEQLNAIVQLLAYSDPTGQTDNPHLRIFDWTRRFSGLRIRNGNSDKLVIPPGESRVVFDGEVEHNLTTSSVMSLKTLSGAHARYRLSITSGPSGFRTMRAVSGITDCTVAVNNNAVATFDFGAADLSAVVVGDILRIKGSVTFDPTPYTFNAINAGVWKIIGISGAKVSCVRLPGEPFSGMAEAVSSVASDVMFFSASGVQKCDKITFAGSFSPSTYRTYEILDITPHTIDFISTIPLAEEESIAYVDGAIVLYSNAKRLLYVEADQDVVIRLDGDTGNFNTVTPIEPNRTCMVGFFLKWGNTFKCEIVNRSINPAQVKWIAGE